MNLYSPHVKLVSYTQPSKDFFGEGDVKTLEDLVVYCARVSNPKNQSNTKTVNNLTKYLIKNKHWSPFQMADVTVEIVSPRDISRQIIRHRSLEPQEFSQRYANPLESLGFCHRDARYQDAANRQNSIGLNLDNESDRDLLTKWIEYQDKVIALTSEAYNWAIEKNFGKEVARVVLPEGLTLSKMYVKGSIRSWLHYIETRSGVEGGTQSEHRDIAHCVAHCVAKVFPEILNHIKQ